VAEPGATVSYLEGCTAPVRDENQLHAAVVELVAHDDATIKYATIQNGYPGDEHGRGGIYNFVTKIGEDQIFYCNQRGISTEDAVSIIVNGFCKEVFRELPMEFAVEATKLLSISLEGSVG